MNRYREGESLDNLGPPVFDYLSAGTAMYAIILGVGLVLAGWRFKQLWMKVWGLGLFIVSVLFLASLWLDIKFY